MIDLDELGRKVAKHADTIGSIRATRGRSTLTESEPSWVDSRRGVLILNGSERHGS